MNDPNKHGTWQEGIFAQHKTKQTNYDRIRAMTDEELADKFEEVQIQAARAYGNDTLLLKGELRKFWLDWLRQEANLNEGSDNLNA